jgi:hypothetical protein
MEDSYIIRIYRREDDAFHKVVGLVEVVETSEKKPFMDRDELWEILKQHAGKRVRRKTGKQKMPDAP